MRDDFGNAITVGSPAAGKHYRRAVDLQLHAWPGLGDALEAALREAPDFALAHALQAIVHATWARGAQARASAAAALSHAGGASERERSHVAIVAATIDGRGADALAQVYAHLERYPGDVLTASTAVGAYGLLAFSGRADHDTARYELLERLAAHLPPELPWLLANRGWARIELGRVDEGLEMAERAIALRPQNGHNAHIVQHGLHERGDAAAILAFTRSWLPQYDDGALMWGHLQWHAALAELALGQEDAALARLLGPILGYLPRGTPFMGLPDVASLLWRLGLRGIRGLPWQVADAHAARHFAQGANVFGELHLALLAAARQDRAALQAVRDRLQKPADRGHAGAPVVQSWVDCLRAWLDGRDDVAEVASAGVLKELTRLGGSHAQRSVVELTAAARRVALA